MKKYILLNLLAFFLLSTCNKKKFFINIDPNDNKHKVSYYIGLQMGTSILNDYSKKDDFDATVLALGINEAVLGKERIDFQKMGDYIQAYNNNKEENIYQGEEKVFEEKINGDKITVDLGKNNHLISFILGNYIGNNLLSNGYNNQDVDFRIVAEAICDRVLEKKIRISEDSCQKAFQAFTQAKSGFSPKKNKRNMEEGLEFLEENKKKKGIITTESGLQYKIIKQGNGARPKATDKVKVHYTGTLIDKRIFDSSVERKVPASFFLNKVIKGWTEGVQLMTVGSKYTFYIPSELAYGANPRSGGIIEPNMVLIFDVELLEIEKPQ